MATKELAASDGEKVFYNACGNRAGPVIFLVHGWRSSFESFSKIVPLLENDFFLIALDLRGHGLTRHVTKTPSLHRLALDISEIADMENISLFHYVGHSMGASVGFEYCRNFGTKCLCSFCNIDMTSRIVSGENWDNCVFGNWNKEQCEDFISRLKTNFVDAVVWYLSISLHPPELVSFRERIESLRESFDESSCVALYEDIAGSDFRETYKLIDVPILNTFAANSEFYLKDTAEWHHINNVNSKLVYFDNSGHFPQISESGRFANTLAEFVRDVEAMPNKSFNRTAEYGLSRYRKPVVTAAG